MERGSTNYNNDIGTGVTPFSTGAIHFRRVHGAELDGTRTAKGELIRHILAHEKIEAPETVMVGDREHDLIGARQNGLRTVAAGWGYGSREELTSQHPEAIPAAPKEASAYLLAMSSEALKESGAITA